jgi:hypothetical protein
MDKSTLARYCLKNFVESPSEKKLRELLKCCDNCLYTICVGSLDGDCPKLCHKLSEERLEAFRFYLCIGIGASYKAYLRVWRERPAELVLHLMRFNAYAESVIGGVNAS